MRSKKDCSRQRSLRRNQTPHEHILWKHLRDKRLFHWKFRRQHPIGDYYVDFVCLPEKLVIELDGSQHAEQLAYDQERTAFLKAHGYRVLRYWNNVVSENNDAVLSDILRALEESI